MVINTIIIEDEAVYAEYLKSLLLQWAEEKIELNISTYSNGSDFLRETSKNTLLQIDIIFIDIILDKADGIAVAKKLRALGFQNTIVFTTNLENRAIDGYTVNAYRYYLKPLYPRDIKECMGYVLEKNKKDYFQYTYHGITERIPFDDILSFESMQHYIDFFTMDRQIRIKDSLKRIQELCPSYFIRCHRSYIINSHHIKSRQENKLILKDGREIGISSKYSKAVAKIMAQRKGG